MRISYFQTVSINGMSTFPYLVLAAVLFGLMQLMFLAYLLLKKQNNRFSDNTIKFSKCEIKDTEKMLSEALLKLINHEIPCEFLRTLVAKQ